jgi:hypothetical protein
MDGQRSRCRKCEARFTRAKGSRRLDCESCSPPRAKSIGEPGASGTAAARGLPTERVCGELEAQTRSDLTSVGRHETTEGALALYLARQLDAGGHSGSQTAALAARLLEAKMKAVAGALPTNDAVDELRRRRERRAAGG